MFIRTSGCNLRCRWCDTPYASWKPEGEKVEIAEILRQVGATPARHCVLTGGEPMIAREIHALAEALKASGYHITIETAGTVAPEGIACDLASISPKLADSTPGSNTIEEAWIEKHDALRLQLDVLRAWIDHYPYQLKFVVSGPEDLAEIKLLLTRLDREIPPSKVLLMPEGTSVEKLRARRDYLVEVCKETGFRLCERLHIEWFGNRRGT